MSEFKSTMAQTSRNLGRLAKEKMEEAEVEIMEKLLPEDLAMEQAGVETNVNKNKKTVVNLKFGDDSPQENCLRQLLLDLESVCSLFQGGNEQVRCKFGFKGSLNYVYVTPSVICINNAKTSDDVMKCPFSGVKDGNDSSI